MRGCIDGDLVGWLVGGAVRSCDGGCLCVQIDRATDRGYRRARSWLVAARVELAVLGSGANKRLASERLSSQTRTDGSGAALARRPVCGLKSPRAKVPTHHKNDRSQSLCESKLVDEPTMLLVRALVLMLSALPASTAFRAQPAPMFHQLTRARSSIEVAPPIGGSRTPAARMSLAQAFGLYAPAMVGAAESNRCMCLI